MLWFSYIPRIHYRPSHKSPARKSACDYREITTSEAIILKVSVEHSFFSNKQPSLGQHLGFISVGPVLLYVLCIIFATSVRQPQRCWDPSCDHRLGRVYFLCGGVRFALVVFIMFYVSREVLFDSRVIGACSVTSD